MPGPSWSISAQRCQTGARLAQQADTPCSACYALKGHFIFPNVEEANERRYRAWKREMDWPDQMAQHIRNHVAVGDPYFRWFSSGDLQSAAMLWDIIDVARATPEIQHWLPTQERGYLIEALAGMAELPPNLVVRVSAPKLNGVMPDSPHTSGVVECSLERWRGRVARNTPDRWHCPAPLNEQYECGSCRACWDPEIRTVLYKKR